MGIFLLIIGFIIGILFSITTFVPHKAGDLYIFEAGDENGIVSGIHFLESPDELKSKKYITIEVHTETQE